jgi:hypothetical protein
MPSLYGFAKEQDATNAKKMHWWVAPKYFFCLHRVKNSKFPLTNGQPTHHNFEVLSIFNGQVGKCHMG